MYLAEKFNPDFRTIARFRKDNETFIKDTFKQTVKLASDYKIVDLSFIGIDGSKVKAYASKKQYFNKTMLYFPPFQLYVFTKKDFLDMLKSKEQTYAKEIVHKKIILKNARIFYELLKEAIENGYKC